MTKFQKALSEAGFSGLGKVTGKNRWRVRIIRAGVGSSGVYTEEALRNTGALAFPKGTKINADHPGFDARMEQPAGSVKTLIGALVTDPIVVVEDGTGVPTLEAEAEFSDESAPFVEQFHEILGMSIHADGYGDEYDDMGRPIINGFIPSPLNTVDLVTVAGAGGKLLALAEAYRAEPRAKIEIEETVNPTGRKLGMTPEEIQALLDKQREAIVAALTPEPAHEDAGPSASEISEALVTADLPKPARDRVYKAIESGTPLTEAIDAEKSYIKEVTESFKANVEEANPGDVNTGNSGDSFAVSAWG